MWYDNLVAEETRPNRFQRMDDHPLSLDEFSTPRLAIVGAQNLRRYTSNILARGFGELGWDLVPLDSAASAIVQLHGAPQSFDDDEKILATLEHAGSSQYPNRTLVLIHRPDEIVVHHPRVVEIVAGLPNYFGIALLGPLHGTDPWLAVTKRRLVTLPHGFFSSLPPNELSGRVVIGSHTTWGEMRDPAHVVSLLVETFKRVAPGTVVGYLGGRSSAGSAPLSEGWIAELCSLVNNGPKIEVVSDYGLVSDAKAKHVIVVNAGGSEPNDMQPTFNVQLTTCTGRFVPVRTPAPCTLARRFLS